MRLSIVCHQSGERVIPLRDGEAPFDAMADAISSSSSHFECDRDAFEILTAQAIRDGAVLVKPSHGEDVLCTYRGIPIVITDG